MKRIAAALSLGLALLLAACGSGGDGTSEAPVSTGPVTITFWHSELASAQENLQKLVDRFNASQDRVQVQAIYQGAEGDLALKLIAGLPSNVPSVAYVMEGMTQTLVDSGQVVPVQRFIDRDGYDLSDFNQAARAFYTIDGTLYAMPMGVLVPLMFYNKLPFREAGLDPDRPPRDLDEARTISEQLTRRDASGVIERYGFALDVNAWYFEFLLAGAGRLYGNNDNGRAGVMTEATFDNDAGLTFFRWWHDMEADGLLTNVGRSPTGADQLLAIGAKRAVMTFSSSAALRSVMDVIAQGMEGVELGVAPIPGIPGAVSDGSPGVYSRSLWIMAGRPVAEQEAAWTFIKWLLEPEQQAEWFAGSGNLPVRQSAYDLPAAKDIVARYPEFQLPADLFARTGTDAATLGPLLGPMEEVRARMTDAIESMLTGGASPEQALAAAVEDANAVIAEYNRRMGR